MVKVREEQPLDIDGRIDIEFWLCKLNENYPSLNLARVREVCDLSEQAEAKAISTNTVWKAGRSSHRTGLDMADILTDLRVDEDGIIAAIIYRAVRENQITLNHVKKQFGEGVGTLVEGVLRMAAISNIQFSKSEVLGEQKDQLEQAKRLLISIVDDVRVALIKLAERTCAIRSIASAEPEKRIKLAREVFEIYSPLAHRLGIGHLKWELEDMSFRYLEPLAYKRIASLLDEKRRDRQDYIVQVIETLKTKLKEVHVEAQVEGRAKHIYSIWRKMQRKGIGFSQVHDIRALRILVDDVAACYQTLGVVHGMWRNIPNEFDDYIASPKENGYRSLHTAVIGPEGKILEVQIRTEEMHEEAELGVCAHWRYKASDAQGAGPDTYEEKLSWLRQVLEWHETVGDDEVIAEQFTFDSTQDRVYVFTPKGDVVSLVQGATPLDFAYHVHTEVGHRCRGARVNGTLVPLTYILGTGERVEILTASTVQPRRDWLVSSLGFLRTARARNRVQQWFKSQNRDENVAAGRELVERECARLALTSLDYKAMSEALSLNTVDDMFAAVGSGDLTSKQVLRVAKTVTHSETDQHPEWAIHQERPALDSTPRVDGVGNLLTQFAGCCMPVPGDGIEGYMTRSRGVTVHRADCARLLTLHSEYPERIIAVNWGTADVELFPVDIELTAYDRQGLLADVTSVLAQASANVTSINTQSHPEDNTAHMRLRAEVSTIDGLMELLARLNQLDNVISARRVVV